MPPDWTPSGYADTDSARAVYWQWIYGLGVHHPATAAAFVVCVLAFAALLHAEVERPFLRLRERFRRSAPVSAPAPAA